MVNPMFGAFSMYMISQDILRQYDTVPHVNLRPDSCPDHRRAVKNGCQPNVSVTGYRRRQGIGPCLGHLGEDQEIAWSRRNERSSGDT